MKKLLENKKFLIIVFILESILLILGVYGAIYDDSHASVAILIMAIFILTIFNVVFFILLAIFKSNQAGFYLKLQGGLIIVFFAAIIILSNFNGGFDDEYEYSEEEIQKMAQEYQMQMKRDSIRLDSIHGSR